MTNIINLGYIPWILHCTEIESRFLERNGHRLFNGFMFQGVQKLQAVYSKGSRKTERKESEKHMASFFVSLKNSVCM